MYQNKHIIPMEKYFKLHELKCHTIFFIHQWDGTKNFEIRLDDRNYKRGDQLLLKEYFADTQEYSGREILVEVTYITPYKQMHRHVVMGTKHLIKRDLTNKDT